MITLFYLDKNGNQQKEMFNVPPEEFIKVEKVLKAQGYKWYTVDKGVKTYDPNQLSLFTEVK
jgi:hypothetical protein